MKKEKSKITSADTLRRTAEIRLIKGKSLKGSVATDAEAIKLSHELAVHQIELEIQNKELKDAKDNLEAALEKYTALYDFAPTGYITLTKEGRIKGLNLKAANMLGQERSHLINNVLALYTETNSKLELSGFLKKIFKNKLGQSCELNLLNTINGLAISVYLVGIAVEEGNQCDISMIDITERKLAEENLKKTLKELATSNSLRKEHEDELLKVNNALKLSLQHNTEIDRFISILAHDLRSPFSIILGYSELLSQSIHDGESEAGKLVEGISKTTQVTFNLLEDLLKWSRVQNGRIPFKPVKLKFEDLYKDLGNLFKPLAIARRVSLNYSAPPDTMVNADIDMLKAILRNLITNAIKFSPVNGSVTITAEQTDSELIVSVADNGNGISQNDLISLFDSVKEATIDAAKGTGLGLFLCKGFVEKHEGKIWAESIIGKGSIFYFTIPGNIGIDKSPDIPVSDLKVLVADDNDALRLILGEFLKKYSKQIIFAKNGAEALSAYVENPDIDLIMMDYFMPEMNGCEAAKHIRILNKDVKIFVETADTLTNITEEFSEVKIDDYFPKPYNKNYLNQLIIKHFGKPDANA